MSTQLMGKIASERLSSSYSSSHREDVEDGVSPFIHSCCVWLHLPSVFWALTAVSSSVEGFPACKHMCSIIFSLDS